MRRFTIALIVLVTALVFGTSRAAATTDSEGQTCYTSSDCGYVSYSTWEDSTYTSDGDPYSQPLAVVPLGSQCKIRHARVWYHNITWITQFTYHEQVRWCWKNGNVNYFRRDRWTGSTGLGWTFDGNIYTNCGPTDVEHCSGKTGAYSEQAYTQGHYHVTVLNIPILGSVVRNKYPHINIWVHGDGGSGASTGM